jgi:hypothetical protein
MDMDTYLCHKTRKQAADLIRHVRRQMMVEDIHIRRNLWLRLNEEFSQFAYDDLTCPRAQALYYVINHNRLWG